MAGKLNFTEDKAPELICNTVSAPSDPAAVGVSTGKQVRPGLYLRFESEQDPHYQKAMRYAAVFDGGAHRAVFELP